MADGQLTLPEWAEKAEQSRIPRFPWKQVLGVPLSHYVYLEKARGLNQEQIITDVRNLLHSRGIIEPKVEENLRVGVSARFSEVKGVEIYAKRRE